MVKRVRDHDILVDERSSKRNRLSSVDRLSALSDELLLKVLSFLPISQLGLCQRLSHKYYKLAGDGQLWKAHYYSRFVLPRASRLPRMRDTNDSPRFASRASRWLDEDHLVKSARHTNWKQQYKLRHNWSRGSCAVSEIEVAPQAPVPPILVQMKDGTIYSADQADGLRAWSLGSRSLIAQQSFPPESHSPPTSLAVDSQGQSARTGGARIIVGFESGSFSIYALHNDSGTFQHQSTQEPHSNGVVSSVALSWPYALTMTATQVLSLYRFEEKSQDQITTTTLGPPRLLHSLKSHTAWPPLAVSLRTATSTSYITICVAYTLPTYLSGWTVGLQEVKVSDNGEMLGSRLASAIDQHYRPLAFTSRPMVHHLTPFSAAAGSSTALELRHIHSKPTSLSYTHPYLLVSHPDNTLTLYLVISTADSLAISAGSRLWGHTSSVSGATVGSRGKAVSVSRRGDELRVWELEGGFVSLASKKRLASGGLSVEVKPDHFTGTARSRGRTDSELLGAAVSSRANARPCALDCKDDDCSSDLTLTRGWIGFDEESVVLLKERSRGEQALVVYDFT